MMNEELKKVYKSIDEVILKPNQVLIKPIKPIIGKSFLSLRARAIISHAVMLIVLLLSIYLIAFSDSLKILGGFLLGVIVVYIVSIYRR